MHHRNNVYNASTPEQESTVLPSTCGIHMEQRNSQEHHTCHALEYFRQGDAYWPTHHEYRRRMNVAVDMSCRHQCLCIAVINAYDRMPKRGLDWQDGFRLSLAASISRSGADAKTQAMLKTLMAWIAKMDSGWVESWHSGWWPAEDS
jgi:hypothetical protein